MLFDIKLIPYQSGLREEDFDQMRTHFDQLRLFCDLSPSMSKPFSRPSWPGDHSSHGFAESFPIPQILRTSVSTLTEVANEPKISMEKIDSLEAARKSHRYRCSQRLLKTKTRGLSSAGF